MPSLPSEIQTDGTVIDRDVSSRTITGDKLENTTSDSDFCLSYTLSEIDPFILTHQIPDAFEQFLTSLPKDLQLQRAGFVLAHHREGATDLSDSSGSPLSIIAISDRDIVLAGLGISIPRKNSALHEVCDSHCLKTVTPAKDFQGNFVERHALVISGDGCLGMYPLEVNQRPLGAVTLNCTDHTAFISYSEQLQLAMRKFTKRISQIVLMGSTEDTLAPTETIGNHKL